MEKIELMCGRILAWTGRGSGSKRGGSLTERGAKYSFHGKFEDISI